MRGSVSEYVPQYATAFELRVRRARALAAWGLLVACTLVFVGLIFAAPLLRARGGGGGTSAVVYAAFGMICHQMPERSFYVAGHPLAVCARCIGIYAGFALVVFVYPLVGSMSRMHAPGRAWLLAATLPLALDFALGFAGLWANTHLSRLATGALVGAAAVFYVMPGVIELSRRDFARRLFSSYASDARGRRA